MRRRDDKHEGTRLELMEEITDGRAPLASGAPSLRDHVPWVQRVDRQGGERFDAPAGALLFNAACCESLAGRKDDALRGEPEFQALLAASA